MAVSCLSLFLSPPQTQPPPPPSIKQFQPLTARNSRLSLLFPVVTSPARISYFRRNAGRIRISSFSENFLLSEAEAVQNSPEIVSTGDDGVSPIISVLLFIAFIGLSVLTIGIIYIAVTDYLTNRESEKFAKEEAAKKKKSGKKGKIAARARAGPRGFGQKFAEEDDD